MVIKANYLLVFILYLCPALLSLGYHELPRRKTDIDRCIDQCREVVEDLSSLFDCAARCDSEYSPELEPEGAARKLEKCQQRCQSEEGSSWRKQQKCRRRCEEKVREREWEPESEQREREEREQREEEREREQQRERPERREREQERERQREREREESERQREREREEKDRDRERERQERERDREREQEEISDHYSRDPEEDNEECLQACRKKPARQRSPCKRRCKRQYEDLKGKKQEEDGDHLGGRNAENHEPHQPYEQCRKQCERQERGEQHQQQCKSWCEHQREKEERRRKGEENPQRESRREEEQHRNNPYYFSRQRFQYLLRSQGGHMKVLQRFKESSELLQGIDNYRLAVAEVNPSTLVVPHHSDAETILVVVRGRGIITFVSNENRESFNMELGEVLRIPAGTTVYLINQDRNEMLQVAMLVHPVNIPGQFREYFAAGGGNPESYYKVFSYDILERALNTPSDELDKLFEGQQRQHGAIRRLTPEQLRALSQHSSPKQRDKESRGPYNLLSQKPLYHNNFGRFFEASPKDYHELQDIGVSVTFAEIKQGAIMVPHYNSKSTTVVFVVAGSGRIEMGCPHLSRQSQGSEERREHGEEEEENSGQLQKITTQLSPGDVFIIPAGHPVALVAQNENLQTVGFGINALNNQRNFLAGKINIMNQVERAAMEKAFNVPTRLVERIFSNNSKESYFVAGSELAGPEEERQRQGGRGNSL